MKEEIKKIFSGEVLDDPETLEKYSHDASLLQIRPKLVLFPKNTKDVQALVKWVSDNYLIYPNLYITPRAAGTCMSGGAIGESLVLDFTKHMNHLVKFLDEIPQKSKKGISPNQNPSITVQPGMYYRDFEKITLEKGLILPCYTASKSINAVGGMYGNNSAGERTLKYGKTEDYVLSAKVVFADGNLYEVKPLNDKELKAKISQNDFEGNIYKQLYELFLTNSDLIQKSKPNVHKNSAGYYIWNLFKDNIFDLNKILVGSQGTLGITTEITLKLVPQTTNSNLVVVFMNDLSPLGRLVDEMLKTNPETLETYDDKTMRLAVRFFFDFLKNKGFLGMFKFMWSFLPEFFMMLSGGFPKLILLAEFAGDSQEEVMIKCLKLKDNIKGFNLKTHITKNPTEANKYWDIRRESFALLRKHVKGLKTAPFIDDIIVRPEFLPKFLPELNKILGEYDIVYTIAGHAGDGNFHIIPLMDFKKEETSKIILELSDRVYELVLRYKGSITGEHNDGIIRTPYLRQMYGEEMVEIFASIKRIFDSKNIFNKGKKVPVPEGPGTKEYLKAHIQKEL